MNSESSTQSTIDELDYDYTELGFDVPPDHIEYGVRYRGFVNNVVDYGLFVTVSRSSTNGDDTSGLVFMKNIPNMYTHRDFERGDDVGVMLIKRDDTDNLDFECVAALDTASEVAFEIEPRLAPQGAEAEQLNAKAHGQPIDDDRPTATRPDSATRDASSASTDADVPALEALFAERFDQLDDALADALQGFEDATAALATTNADADSSEASTWPGNYATIIALLARARDDGLTVAGIEYDESARERTLAFRLVEEDA